MQVLRVLNFRIMLTSVIAYVTQEPRDNMPFTLTVYLKGGETIMLSSFDEQESQEIKETAEFLDVWFEPKKWND